LNFSFLDFVFRLKNGFVKPFFVIFGAKIMTVKVEKKDGRIEWLTLFNWWDKIEM